MLEIGLVLSGGGARGVAHLGSLKALEELGVRISAISGTSSGAIIAVFYAAGFSPEKIIEIARSSKFFGFSNLVFGKAGLFDMRTFEAVFKTHFPDNLIENLPMPVHIAATDIVRGKTRYFNQGNLSKALMASSCLPMVFQPVEYEDSVFLDGAILNNFPIEPLLEGCKKTIGIHVNSMSQKLEVLHMKDMLDRSFHLSVSSKTIEKSSLCDLFIEPPEMSRFGMFDLSKTDEIFEFAYRYTISLQKQIEERIKQI